MRAQMTLLVARPLHAQAAGAVGPVGWLLSTTSRVRPVLARNGRSACYVCVLYSGCARVRRARDVRSPVGAGLLRLPMGNLSEGLNVRMPKTMPAAKPH